MLIILHYMLQGFQRCLHQDVCVDLRTGMDPNGKVCKTPGLSIPNHSFESMIGRTGS